MWNRIKTVVLLASLSGLFMLFGALLGGRTGLTIALILSLFMNLITYYYSDRMVLALYRAKPLNKQEYPEIYRMVDDLAHTMNIPMPKLWLITTPMANAFATGRNPQHASVAVTTGILTLLTDRELRGVLAHELSHVKNRDILISTIAATLASAIGYLANISRFAAFSSGSSSDNQRSRTNPIFVLLASLLMPLAATLIQLAISRSREYMADESGAEVSHDPLALADALEKLERNIPRAHLSSDDVAHASTAPLFIVHPFLPGTLMSLFSTHPPIKDRIAKLRKLDKYLHER